ncbi:MAG TPA: AMP-binding protein [Solirubrobacteraceae bacterium]|nr:AMP-binding protein [Solirubrobacteraceae bacterium]
MRTPGECNLARLAEQAFERRGDYPSLLFEGRWHGSGELFERSCRLAGGLAQAGVRPGERVVVTMANCPEVGIAYNGLWRAGAVVTPATFLLPEPELRHVIADAGASAVITTPEFLGKVTAAVEGLEHVRFVACAGECGPEAIPLHELEQGEPAAIAPRGDDELAALLYTGGTTGRAKGVMLSHRNLWFTGAAATAASHIEGVNRALATLPLSHSYGILVTIAGMHSPEAGVAVLLRWFNAKTFLELVAEHRLQISALVPSMLALLAAEELERYDLSSLQILTSGGAPLAPELVAEWARRVPHVTIRQGYGLTESAALISTTPVGEGKPGSVGRPVPGGELRIVDEDGIEVEPGEVGEIICRSPAIMQGYWNSPEATDEALRDGWLYTGDLGYVDEDGYLFVVDRKKDLIIRNGFNVYPRDVEDALVEHPAVAMAGVVGRPDPRHGEEVVAFVSLNAGQILRGEDLIGWARERIGGYKYPREVHIVSAVPLTPVGKIDRKALRALVARPQPAPAR